MKTKARDLILLIASIIGFACVMAVYPSDEVIYAGAGYATN